MWAFRRLYSLIIKLRLQGPWGLWDRLGRQDPWDNQDRWVEQDLLVRQVQLARLDRLV